MAQPLGQRRTHQSAGPWRADNAYRRIWRTEMLTQWLCAGDADQAQTIATMEPEYACGVISNGRGWLLWQIRPATARYAAGELTCFGGRRENAESAAACLRRELHEEIGWIPTVATPCCELWNGPRFIAHFFSLNYSGGVLRLEPGHGAIWAPIQALPGLPISMWHRLVFSALVAGQTRAEIR